MDDNYNASLAGIGLAWLPWFGDKFKILPAEDKYLFVGESHYFNKPEEKASYDNPNMTKKIVNWMALGNNNGKSPFFKNIHRLVFGTADLTREQRADFWSTIAFYNFIQKAMDTKKGRPGKDDFVEGWKVFFRMITVLKPRACVFLGISAGNFYKGGSKYKYGLTLNKNFKWGETVFGRSRSIFLEFTHPDGAITSLYFIKHPSNFFSPKTCRDFLRTKNVRMMDFLKKSIEISKPI